MSRNTADGAAGYRGGFEAVDAASSKVVWRFETDPKLNFKGQPIGGGINRGCGSVWSSAAVDPDPNVHLVYFGTGDCGQDAPPPYQEAVIALDSITGAPKWVSFFTLYCAGGGSPSGFAVASPF